MKLEHQSAFQQKSIAADHLFVVKCLVDKYMKTGNRKLHVYAWFADFRKVFETGNKVKKKMSVRYACTCKWYFLQYIVQSVQTQQQ